MSVKRYSAVGMGFLCRGKEEVLIDGQQVVLASDYEALAAREAKLREALESIANDGDELRDPWEIAAAALKP